MSEDEAKPISKAKERKILKAVKKAISLAEEDTGLEPKNYGMLEERIRWYLELDRFNIGYIVEIEFHFEEYFVEITKLKEIPEDDRKLGEDVSRRHKRWRMPEM